jgi:hypothetical protein
LAKAALNVAPDSAPAGSLIRDFECLAEYLEIHRQQLIILAEPLR